MDSFIHAWAGLIHTVVHQRNMRIHLTAAMLVSLVGSGVPLGLAEKVTLIFCVLLVFFAEVLNSALEHLVDLATEELDPQARIAKDAAAAGVLVLSLGTVVIFAAVLVHNAANLHAHRFAVLRQASLGIPLTLAAVVLMTGGRRSLWMDAVALAIALALWAMLVVQTFSVVFSAMTLGLLGMAAAAAYERRRESRANVPPPS